MTRLIVLVVALMFIAAFAFLTFASVVEGGFTLASLLSVFILDRKSTRLNSSH